MIKTITDAASLYIKVRDVAIVSGDGWQIGRDQKYREGDENRQVAIPRQFVPKQNHYGEHTHTY